MIELIGTNAGKELEQTPEKFGMLYMKAAK